MTRGTADSEPVEPEGPRGPEGEQQEQAPGEEDRSTRGKSIGVKVFRFVLNGFADDVADRLVWAARQAWKFGASFL
ncbi:hypothetical protein [Streptomyces sp. NPDC058622]|uniref:hypothetical protein n=1 Tax=Streptomyces sp. NPDC058622 TaxID=3346562 RepID=UPI003664D20A